MTQNIEGENLSIEVILINRLTIQITQRTLIKYLQFCFNMAKLLHNKLIKRIPEACLIYFYPYLVPF